MAAITADTWQTYAQSCAYLGNSLLGTVRQTSDIGLSPGFWLGFPLFGSDDIEKACNAMVAYVESLSQNESFDPVTEVSAEYTHLFIGPPKPAAAPWETFYFGEGSDVGFGQPTHEMRKLLREAGLELQNENNQYEDHMGIELLYVSVLCTRLAEGNGATTSQALKDFLETHPLSWIDKFYAAITADTPNGYYAHLLSIAKAVLESLRSVL